jgi:DNA-binding transcriptional regulator GbsR (MarR family)
MKLQGEKLEICYLLSKDSLNFSEISDKICGYQNSRVSSCLSELIEMKLIEPIGPNYAKGQKKDRRKRYYKVTKIFLDKISQKCPHCNKSFIPEYKGWFD